LGKNIIIVLQGFSITRPKKTDKLSCRQKAAEAPTVELLSLLAVDHVSVQVAATALPGSPEHTNYIQSFS